MNTVQKLQLALDSSPDPGGVLVEVTDDDVQFVVPFFDEIDYVPVWFSVDEQVDIDGTTLAVQLVRATCRSTAAYRPVCVSAWASTPPCRPTSAST